MRVILSIILFATFGVSLAQQKVTFAYDAAGNQISRVLCLSGCTAKPVKEIKEPEAVVEADLEKFFPEDQISYYPNPVKEELFIKWELLDENKVSFIMVYGLNGKVLHTYAKTEMSNAQNLSFRDYSTGVYLVVLNYTNGDQKTIKIIKQ